MVHQGQHHRQNSALWDKVHTDIALRTAHQWASRWARAARRRRADQEDMAQDILVAALIRSRHFDPAKAAWPTFIDLVARHALADRIQAERRAGPASLSLDGLPPDVVLQSATLPASGDTATAAHRCIALRAAQQLLPDDPRETLGLLVLAEGDNAAACRASGRSSSAFYRDIAELRLWLRASGLAPPRQCAGKNRGVNR